MLTASPYQRYGILCSLPNTYTVNPSRTGGDPGPRPGARAARVPGLGARTTLFCCLDLWYGGEQGMQPYVRLCSPALVRSVPARRVRALDSASPAATPAPQMPLCPHTDPRSRPAHSDTHTHTHNTHMRARAHTAAHDASAGAPDARAGTCVRRVRCVWCMRHARPGAGRVVWRAAQQTDWTRVCSLPTTPLQPPDTCMRVCRASRRPPADGFRRAWAGGGGVAAPCSAWAAPILGGGLERDTRGGVVGRAQVVTMHTCSPASTHAHTLTRIHTRTRARTRTCTHTRARAHERWYHCVAATPRDAPVFMPTAPPPVPGTFATSTGLCCHQRSSLSRHRVVRLRLRGEARGHQDGSPQLGGPGPESSEWPRVK